LTQTGHAECQQLGKSPRLIEEGLPLAAARWPKPRRHMAAE
jgi:hypothetical protein